MLLVCPRDPGSVVSDLHLDIRPGSLKVQVDHQPGPDAVFERVFEEVDEDLLETHGIGLERQVPTRRKDAHRSRLAPDRLVELFDDMMQERAEVDALDLERDGTRFRLGYDQKIINQAAETITMATA